MAIYHFPTSKDIFIEVNGRRLAVAQSYRARSVRESRVIEAFGSEEPVGTVGGRTKHVLQLSRVILSQAALDDGINFYDLQDFNVVIVFPHRKVVFSGCEWSDITQSAQLSETALESVTIAAAKRMELK